MLDCKILLDHPEQPAKSLLFINAVEVIETNRLDEVENCLKRLEQKTQSEGLYAAGFINYEAGYAFEEFENSSEFDGEPLLKFGLFKNVETLTRDEAKAYFKIHTHGEYALDYVKPLESQKQYIENIKKIKAYIAAGDIYQANYTFQVELGFKGDLMGFYESLKQSQNTQLGGILSFDDRTILSLSPELFFNKKGSQFTARPMKGTAPRGENSKKDLEIKNWLKNDEKNRAENLMIVDLLRNDLSRLSKIGSVKVPKLFEIETYESLFQMTSTIKSEIEDNISFSKIFSSLFPCGSVTGAPKIRAQEIIRELENQKRGAYCGSIGYITPDGDMNFNVAIRTITAMRDEPNKLRLGIGSGIVIDSNPREEYQECLLKMKFLTDLQGEFQLIESLCLDQGKIDLIEGHLDRLCTSSRYFDFEYKRSVIRKALYDYCEGLDQKLTYKVRMLLFKSGRLEFSSMAIEKPKKDQVMNVALSEVSIERGNIFTRHKTTKRQILDQSRERLKQSQPDLKIDEVIFCNRQGNLTEGSYTTIFVEKDGIFYTPPLSAGCLNGVWRRHLLDNHPEKYKIKNIKYIDITSDDKLWIGNSVRGMMRVNLLD